MCVCVCMYIHIHITYIHTYIYIYIYIYVYIGAEPGRGVLKTRSSLATPQVCSSKLGSKSVQPRGKVVTSAAAAQRTHARTHTHTHTPSHTHTHQNTALTCDSAGM
jgi:hypothetical protein